MANPTPPATPTPATLLQTVLDQTLRYGLATVLAILLVGYLVYERVETDRQQNQTLQGILDNQALLTIALNRQQEAVTAATAQHERLIQDQRLQAAQLTATLNELRQSIENLRLDLRYGRPAPDT